MQKSAVLTLLSVIAGVAGCGSHETGEPAVQESAAAMVLIPAGDFTMGDSAGRADENPHAVTVSAFYLDRHPVTQQMYEEVMGINPSKHKGQRNPVERTQWTDAVRFCNKCSELEGLTPCYNLETWECNYDANGYRLPTEAEWEYACRAGGAGKYCFGDSEAELPKYAWFKPLSQGKPRPVGQKLPNRFGLVEMHGNVWQWCNDWYGEIYADSPREDPRGPATGTMRVLRGGAWDCTAEKLRSAYRHKEFPVYSDACFGADSYGFRRARSADSGNHVASVDSSATSSSATTKPGEQPDVAVSETNFASEPDPASIDVSSLKGTIVFVSDRSGAMKIWSMHASGRDAKQLTTGTDPDADPRFSPDGKRILYTTLRGGFPELWLMNRDGTEPKFVTNGSQGSWAPDGTSIVFINDNQTFVRDFASGREERATPEEWERCGVPAFAPDGKRLAVASRHLGEIGIFLIDADDQESIQLKAGEACCTPQWSKDGQKILCQTVQGHIHQVRVDGEDWEQLTFGADVQHDARYSPDGTMILFCRAPSPEGPWQICLKTLAAEDEEEVTQITREGSNLLPDWHPAEE
jgi:formylglycine-generating enzyme